MCIVETPEVVIANKVRHVIIGQGEGDTKWKGWAWKLLLTRFVIVKKKYVTLHHITLLNLKMF